MFSTGVLTQIFGSLEESQTIYGKLYVPNSVDTASIRFTLEVKAAYVKLKVSPWCFIIGKNCFGGAQAQPVFPEVSQIVKAQSRFARKIWAFQFALPIRWSLVEDQLLKDELLDIFNRTSEDDWVFEKFSNAQTIEGKDGKVYERVSRNDASVWVGKRVKQSVPIIFGDGHVHFNFSYAQSMLVEGGYFSPLLHITQFFFRGFTNL